MSNETVIINKPLTLKGTSLKKTTFFYDNTSDQAFLINSSYVKLQDFTITFKTPVSEISGIHIKKSNNTIENIRITNSFYGIYLDAYSEKNQINNCTFLDNNIALYSNYAQGNIIKNNLFSNNSNYGIYLTSHSKESKLFQNTFTKNTIALRIKTSEFNRINNNSFQENSQGIVICCNAKYNLIYANNFIKNDIHANDPVGNQWYYQNTGNYWDDYMNFDDNQDGRGDVPYPIPTLNEKSIVSDNYPLLSRIS